MSTFWKIVELMGLVVEVTPFGVHKKKELSRSDKLQLEPRHHFLRNQLGTSYQQQTGTPLQQQLFGEYSTAMSTAGRYAFAANICV